MPLGDGDAVAAACAHLGRALAAPGDTVDATLGSVRLMAHQRDAVARLRRALARLGGALLADPVGTGKTYVALAIAAAYEQVTVLAPAGLRDPWARAMDATRVRATWRSYEGTSRRDEPRAPPTGGRRLVILDEAHHLRNPATQRYGRVARLAWGADVLLLTATPLHNRAADLVALTALFLGASARALRAEELAGLTCRRLDALPAGLPTLDPPTWVPVPGCPAVLHALLALPPALPPADGGRADALGRLALLRQWASSDAALEAAIARRLATGLALEARLREGHHPTRAELRRWVVGPDTLQLGLPLHDPAAAAPRAAALAAVGTHLEGLRRLREAVRGRHGDVARIARLRATLGDLAGRRAVLFTHSADTARATYEALVRHHRCALLTGRGPRVAAGRASRAEITRQFDPARPPRATARAMHVDVLVATDLLSEGVDLHDAGLLVHLDLPWTVARLEQRAGRLRRLGATHDRLRHVALEPPGGLDRVLRLGQRLARKAGLTAAHLGDALLDFGLVRPGTARTPPPEAAARLASLARTWQGGHDAADRLPLPVVGALACQTTARFLAVVTDGAEARVVVGTVAGVSSDPTDVARAGEAAARHLATSRTGSTGTLAVAGDRPSARTVGRRRELALAQLTRWCATEVSRGVVLGHRTGPAHREALRIVASARPTRARQAARALAPLLARARALILASHGAGAEHLLGTWARAFRNRAPGPGDLSTLCDVLAPRARPRAAHPPRLEIVAVLLLVPPPDVGPDGRPG